MASTTEFWGHGWKKEVATNYDYKGRLNTKSHRWFKNICRMKQMNLKSYLDAKLNYYYKEVINGDGFLYARGTNSNVLLTAHMDTVHEKNGRVCKDIYEYKKNGKTILSSPQGIGGDDRCGIYTILKILADTDFRPSILFCEDEEIGGVGSSKFCKTEYVKELEGLNYMIEIDRANKNDCVFYDDDNKEFQRYIEDVSETELSYGSFSDICNLSEATEVSSVNLSCGYYNAHTTSEYVVFEELELCIERIKTLLEVNQADDKKFKYEVERWYSYNNNNYYGYYGYNNNIKNSEVCVEFSYEEDGKTCYDCTIGYSVEECVGMFLIDHPDLSWNKVLDYFEC